MKNFKNLADQISAIHREIIEEDGISLNPFTNQKPVSGYMVSLEGLEEKISISDMNDEKLFSFIWKHRELLAASDDSFRLYFGAWVSNGFVYLDISIN